jgi:hypothetical protein
MKPRLALFVLLGCGLLLAAPAAASADDYCVGSPPGCSGTPKPDLQTALDAAKATTGTADRVLVGPGTYTRPDGFDYQDGNVANTVDIQGVGSPQPVITLTATASQKHALTLQQAGSSVSNLTFDVPNTAFSLFGLFIGAGTTAHDVTVTGPTTNTAFNTGVQVIGGTLRDSTINAGVAGAGSIGVDARTNSLVEDNTIFGSRGMDVFANAQVIRDKISAVFTGLYVYGSNNTKIENTLVDMRGGTGGTTRGIHASTVPSGLTTTIDASQLTIRNGDSHTVGVGEETGNASSTITVNLTDSIIRDVAHPLEQGTPPATSTFTFTGDHDDYDQSANLGTVDGLTVVRTETSLVNLDPHFVTPVSGVNGITGDYRLAADSPVIDAGSTTPLGLGETDLAGMPRIVDGAAPCAAAIRDLGAYEFQGSCAPPSGGSPTAQPGPTGQQAAALKKCKRIKNKVKRKKCKKRARRLPL